MKDYLINILTYISNITEQTKLTHNRAYGEILNTFTNNGRRQYREQTIRGKLRGFRLSYMKIRYYMWSYRVKGNLSQED